MDLGFRIVSVRPPTVGAMSPTSSNASLSRPAAMEGWGPSFDTVALAEVTFTVVDLETTGISVTHGAKITEIGAVQVCGGEVVGEFQTLVNPGQPISAFITTLTGISNEMVRQAPSIETSLPAFLEFAKGTVLVAHNAPFDVGFLQHEAASQHQPWPDFDVVDTATLARRVLSRDDTPDCTLSSLATIFGANTQPNHRALADARATVDVLHGLIDKLSPSSPCTVARLKDSLTSCDGDETSHSRADPRRGFGAVTELRT